jgi:hypothetical protein
LIGKITDNNVVLLFIKGHGEYTEIAEEKDFFEMAKKSSNFVCHFYRDDFFRCKVIDKHLNILARKHMETKFCKINAEKCPFLTGIYNQLLVKNFLKFL